jgi:hypothetical protein
MLQISLKPGNGKAGEGGREREKKLLNKWAAK